MSADPYPREKSTSAFSSADSTASSQTRGTANKGPRVGGGNAAPNRATARPAPSGQAGNARQSVLSSWERRQRVKLQARKVRRIIRYVSPWSVLRVSIIFFAFMWAASCVSAVVLWTAAERNGMIEDLEGLVTTFLAQEEFAINGGDLFRRFAFITAVLAIFGTMMSTLLCVVFNLISDLVGGIRLTVIEEESVRFRPPKRRIQQQAPQRR